MNATIGAGHAQARVRVDVVREKTGFDELGAGVAFSVMGRWAAQPEGQARLVALPRLFLSLRTRGRREYFVPARSWQTSSSAGALCGFVPADRPGVVRAVANVAHPFRQVVAWTQLTFVDLVVRRPSR